LTATSSVSATSSHSADTGAGQTVSELRSRLPSSSTSMKRLFATTPRSVSSTSSGCESRKVRTGVTEIRATAGIVYRDTA
jgi:hypothetical protein